ncbi:MAG: plasmid stabilization protein [Candidatus Sumerlaeota bacterium]|nr:plasmid stabilization protein [Candidatus Sumerlaeota bacterium]
MAQLTLRNLDDKVIAGLKSRATSQGRTLQAEAGLILEHASRVNPEAARKLAERIQRKFKKRPFADSTQLLRETRGQ